MWEEEWNVGREAENEGLEDSIWSRQIGVTLSTLRAGEMVLERESKLYDC